MQHAPGLTAVLNPDRSLQYLNPEPSDGSPALGSGRDFLDLVYPADAERFRDVLSGVIETPTEQRVVEVRLRDAAGAWRDYEATVTNLVDMEAVGGLVVNARDVTERKILEDELRHQAFHDPLTGLPNRALFMEQLADALTRAQDSGQRVAVLFLDIDRFKVINDSLGHNVGDELLVALAGRLRTTIPEGAMVARFGGDEFTILLENAATDSIAADYANRILDAMRDPVKLLGHNTIVTASIGISFSGPDRYQALELVRSADVALYHAKDQGRGRFVLFDRALDRYSVQRFELEAELRQAVELHQLRLHYQPELDLQTGEVVGFEALVRWEHPVRGLIPPDQFISMAEETGEILKIGQWVLREACRQAAEWQRTLFGPRRFTMSVNLSANEFLEPGLVWEVLRTLRDTGLDPHTLRIEITESVLMTDSPLTREIFMELKRVGIGLAIDDFGTGYSSLNYLRMLPADVLKIDRGFVAEVDRDEREAAIVRAVVQIADALGMHVTAEGIEREEQRVFLANIGSHTGQGFLFARPAPAEVIEAYVRENLSSIEAAS